MVGKDISYFAQFFFADEGRRCKTFMARRNFGPIFLGFVVFVFFVGEERDGFVSI
jgi:hypothetical protein